MSRVLCENETRTSTSTSTPTRTCKTEKAKWSVVYFFDSVYVCVRAYGSARTKACVPSRAGEARVEQPRISSTAVSNVELRRPWQQQLLQRRNQRKSKAGALVQTS